MKTKANYLVMAVAALAMAGCSQNEVTDMNPDANPAISFGVYTGTQTRGTETTTGSIETQEFGILAYATLDADWAGSTETPNFMYNQEVTHAASDWTYTPVKYWPNSSNKITFFGYAPYSTGNGITLSAVSAKGNPTITFAVNDVADKMVDLVADETQKDKTKDMNGGTVSFKFKHILSRVNLVAKADKDLSTGTIIMVTGVKINKPEGSSPSQTGAKFYKTATYTTNLSTGDGKWAAGTPFSADYDLVSLLNKAAPSPAIDGYTTSGIKVSGTTEASLFKTGQYLFPIPIESGFAKGDIKMTISYDVVTTDTNLASKVAVSHETATVDLPANTLATGTAYKYTFSISTSEVKVAATVENWAAEQDGGSLNI